jgi:hypothetical protein
LAVWGYSLVAINPEIDALLLKFYHETVGPYWDNARRLVEEQYASIPFPFEQIPAPRFHIRLNWTLEHFTGYLTSWSATQNFIKAKGENPVIQFREQLMHYWREGDRKAAIFPLFLKLGKIDHVL